jgi:hypothetical protein
MTNVYSIPSKDVYLDINADDDDTILLTIEFEGGSSESVRVDPTDLARELITASPGFALSIGELVQEAVLKYLREDVEMNSEDAESQVGVESELA